MVGSNNDLGLLLYLRVLSLMYLSLTIPLDFKGEKCKVFLNIFIIV